MLVAEEQPIAPRCAAFRAFLQEGAERGDAGAGAYHDDILCIIIRQPEALVALDITFYAFTRLKLCEEMRAEAKPGITILQFMAGERYGEMNFARMEQRT